MTAGGIDELKKAYLKVRQRIKSHSETTAAAGADGNVDIPVVRDLLIQIAGAADVDVEDDPNAAALLDAAQAAAVGIVEQLEVCADGADVRVPKKTLMPLMKFIAARIASTQGAKSEAPGGTQAAPKQVTESVEPPLSAPPGVNGIASVRILAAVEANTAPLAVLPVIKRVRICLLGGDALPSGVGKTDVASALMRGITCDWPGMLDPMYDFAYDCGVFEKAWAELLADPPEDQPIGDRWGIGPLGAWSIQGHIFFSPKGNGRTTPPYDTACNEESAALCAGNPEKLNLGHTRAAGICRTFREIFNISGLDGSCLEEMHKEMSVAAESSPQQLVRKDRPAKGFLASFARFIPEVGNFEGCGAVFLDVFEPGVRPHDREQNVAMVYTAAPNSRTHTGLTAGSYLRALQFTGCNIARLLRQYNGDVSGEMPGDMEKAEWHKTDLRQQVEYYLSDRNLRADPGLQHIASDPGAWLDMEEIAEGVATQKELLEALGSSKTVATKVDVGGKGFLRPAPSRVLPTPAALASASGVAKRKLDAMCGPCGAQAKRAPGPGSRMMMTPDGQLLPKGGGKGKDFSDDRMCWDWARGTCTKGAACKWVHMTLPNGLPPTEPRAQDTLNAMGYNFPGVQGGGPAFGGAAPASAPPAAAPRHPVDPSKLVVGAWVQIQGLATKTEFNGRIGALQTFDEENGRWDVQLADGLTLKVKEENILVSPGSLGGSDGAPQDGGGDGSKKGPSTQFRPGARVRIQGLQGDTSYNGNVGVCNFFDDATGRWDVQLDEGGSLRVKEVNLYRCFS